MFRSLNNPSLSKESMFSMESNMVFVSSSLEQATELEKLSTVLGAKEQFDSDEDAQAVQTSYECLCDSLGMEPETGSGAGAAVSMESFDTMRKSMTSGLKKVFAALAEAFRRMLAWFKGLIGKTDPRIHMTRKELTDIRTKVNKLERTSLTIKVPESVVVEITGEVSSADSLKEKLRIISNLVNINEYIGQLSPNRVQDVRDEIVGAIKGKSTLDPKDLLLGPVVTGKTLSKADARAEDWKEGSKYTIATKVGITYIVQETRSDGARVVSGVRSSVQGETGKTVTVNLRKEAVLTAIDIGLELLDQASKMLKTVDRISDILDLLAKETAKAAQSDEVGNVSIEDLRLIQSATQDSQMAPVVCMKALLRTSSAISRLCEHYAKVGEANPKGK